MKKTLLAAAVSLTAVFGAQAAQSIESFKTEYGYGVTAPSTIALTEPDQAFVERAAAYGITDKNWDTGRSVKATFTNSYKFLKSHKIVPSSYVHNIGEAKGFDLDSVTATDIDGEYPMSIILRDRLNFDALVILKDGQLVDEYYWSGMERGRVHQMNSVTKSFTSIILQQLVDEGKVDMSKKVSDYIPELANNPVWSKVTVQEASDMRTGVKIGHDGGRLWDTKMTTIQQWNGPNTEYPEMTSIVEYADELGPDTGVKVGERYDYHCINTEMMGQVIVHVTGKNISENFQERIWNKVGMEYPAYMLANDAHEGMASGGLVASTRDLARMMDVLVNDGKNRKGDQIVSGSFTENLLKGNDEVRLAWENNQTESLISPTAWYKDQIRTFNLEDGSQYITFIGTNGQTAIGNPETGVVIAFNGAQDEYQAVRTVSMTYLDVVPTLLKAIDKVK